MPMCRSPMARELVSVRVISFVHSKAMAERCNFLFFLYLTLYIVSASYLHHEGCITGSSNCVGEEHPHIGET